ncbi:MAG TPA: iron ABC transporter permease [Acidimicrobiales bacterium]|nr:iron ABC transporter permease [Acidimicrobiales bacterium]
MARARRAPLTLSAASALVALGFATPLAYLVSRVAVGDVRVSSVVGDEVVQDALFRTIVLATLVAASAAVVGTALAWLVARSDLPFRRVFAVLVPLPLVFPSFVGALALRASVAPGGLLESLPLGIDRLPQVDGLFGSWLVLTLFTYPYVQLPVAARLRALSPSLEESARLLGRRPLAVFVQVVLPQARTAIAAGTLLVFLYAVSDFGAVDLLGYPALTRVIYANRVLRRDLAMALGLVLAVVALLVTIAERRAARNAATAPSLRTKRSLTVPLGRWRWPAFALVVFFLLNAIAAPVLSLAHWTRRGLSSGSLDVQDADLWTPVLNTAGIALVTALVAVAVVLPLAFLSTRYRSRIAGPALTLVVGGFALPGIVIALSMVFLSLNSPLLDRLYQTFVLLVVAYVVHFGAQSVRAAAVAVSSVPARLDDAARMLGADRWRRLFRIDIPLMAPGLAAGGGLVLLSTMKELPATLLLAPIGFETLATRIWSATEANALAEAGLTALVLLAVSGLLTWLLVVRRAELLD